MAERIYHAFRITAARPEGRVGVTLVLDGALEAAPGQFVMVWLPGIEERPLAVVQNAPLTLTVQVVGPFTRALASRQVGERVWVRGPYGRGFPLEGSKRLLIGGGSGIASLAMLAKQSLLDGAEVMVALGGRGRESLMLPWWFEEQGIPLLLATEDGSAGVQGTVVSAVAPWIAEGWPAVVYACGPEPMMIALWEHVREKAIPMYVSLERVMKCGLGVCGSCHCGGYLVCQDGPVFPAEVLAQIAP